jgi:hypothetical protein
MQDKILSIQEINEIERGYSHGVPTLGFAAKALLQRWQLGIKDEETLVRLIFLLWYRMTEPVFLTGLDEFKVNDISVESLMHDSGREIGLSGEARFVVAVLGHGAYAFGLGSEVEWHGRSRRFFAEAAEMESQSLLFADWMYLIGEAEDSKNLKTKIEREIHARFNGRGYMGEYLTRVLSGMLRPNRIAV